MTVAAWAFEHVTPRLVAIARNQSFEIIIIQSLTTLIRSLTTLNRPNSRKSCLKCEGVILWISTERLILEPRNGGANPASPSGGSARDYLPNDNPREQISSSDLRITGRANLRIYTCV